MRICIFISGLKGLMNNPACYLIRNLDAISSSCHLEFITAKQMFCLVCGKKLKSPTIIEVETLIKQLFHSGLTTNLSPHIQRELVEFKCRSSHGAENS